MSMASTRELWRREHSQEKLARRDTYRWRRHPRGRTSVTTPFPPEIAGTAADLVHARFWLPTGRLGGPRPPTARVVERGMPADSGEGVLVAPGSASPATAWLSLAGIPSTASVLSERRGTSGVRSRRPGGSGSGVGPSPKCGGCPDFLLQVEYDPLRLSGTTLGL